MNTATPATPVSAELDVYARYPIEIESGSGVELRTSDGRVLLDLYGGHATAVLGYDHPVLVDVIAKQARKLFFQSNAVHVAVRERAARALIDNAPGMARVFFVNSGGEANENALRVACKATGRSRVVALRGGFHGRTAAAAACTDGHDAWYGFAQTPIETVFVEPNDIAALTAAVDQNTAAVIVEPVQGMAGAVVLDREFLAAARATSRDHGALLIADEVQCGIGRCGSFFAIQASGVVPDLLTTAKGIAGGFPCGALLLTEAVADGVARGDLGTTFGGGPLACALIEATVNEVTKDGFLDGVLAREEAIRAQCLGGVVESIQGRGLLLGLRTRVPAREVVAALLESDILTGGAKDPHIVRLLPPLTIDDTHVATLAAALKRIAS